LSNTTSTLILSKPFPPLSYFLVRQLFNAANILPNLLPL
jgi:hypothetical protein